MHSSKIIKQCSTYVIISVFLFLSLLGMGKAMDGEAPPTEGEIKGAIERRLKMDSRLQDDKINVKVENGHATLFGQVPTLEQKGFATTVGVSVNGIQSLVNKLEVPPQLDKDEEILNTIKLKLRNEQLLSENKVDVRVDKQVVRLEGTVKTRKEKREAARLTENTNGVREVQNLLKVAPKPREDEEIYKDVVHYLMWSPLFSDKDITVAVDNGIVKLGGTIDHLIQRDVLEIDIGNIHGVEKVEVGKLVPAKFMASSGKEEN